MKDSIDIFDACDNFREALDKWVPEDENDLEAIVDVIRATAARLADTTSWTVTLDDALEEFRTAKRKYEWDGHGISNNSAEPGNAARLVRHVPSCDGPSDDDYVGWRARKDGTWYRRLHLEGTCEEVASNAQRRLNLLLAALAAEGLAPNTVLVNSRVRSEVTAYVAGQDDDLTRMVSLAKQFTEDRKRHKWV